MKKIKVLALCAIVAGFATSCQKEEISNETQEVVSQEVSKAHLEALSDAGVNTAGAEYVTVQHLGQPAFKALQSGDIIIALDKLAEQSLAKSSDNSKQYRTNNLVSQGRTIRVTGWTGSGNALTSTMRTALQWAINNYNRENINLSFVLTYGTDQSSNVDMVVYNNNQSGGGGSAGFPSGGRPNKYIQINAGTDRFGTNVVEHVITHEIGHSIGFRHQDWKTRQSCNQSGESAGSVGASLIPGTDSSDRAPSIMLACFGGNEDGEFKGDDTKALRTLYPN